MKNGHNVIRGKPLEDRIGPYIGYCINNGHMGIVRYNQYKKCEKRNCPRYVKFRPEGNKVTDIMVAIYPHRTRVQISTNYAPSK